MKTTSVRTRTSVHSVLSLAAVALLVTGAVLYAGPLNPPAGPIASTGKTLTEVEPRIAINATNTPGDADSLFKITQPGSYYLTGNITGVVGKHGIEIVARGVTLDLNGFDLVGVPTMGAFDGVSVSQAGSTNIAVVNGSVRDWGDEGVDLLGTIIVPNCRVEGVLAHSNDGSGIIISESSTVTNCSAFDNGTTGISTGRASTVTNCTAYNNITNGINTGTGCTVANCTAFLNAGNGINVGSGSTVTNCAAFNNITNGINTGTGCTVANCTAYSNTGNGIVTSGASTVADCTVRSNTFDGIVCVTSCLIRGNTCTANGAGGDGAGIHATGSDNRIEGNTCTDTDRGIDVDASGNIIIKNTCSGNATDWVIVANNVVGPILDRRVPASAAINGFSAPSSLGTTDPNANFSY